MTDIRHGEATVNGIRIRYARMTGGSEPLLLLHGWPEFWLTWEPVMRLLAAEGFDLIAPDLRGFGDSDKPDLGPSDRAGADVHASDMLALIDAVGLGRVGVVSHDVGAYVAQVMAHKAADRLNGLFFFNCPYHGIGPRWAEAGHLKEIWYQSFHQMPWAADLVGSSRDACKIYFRHFLTYWAGGNPSAFDDVLDAFVDNFLKPGNLQGGFNWYISQNAARMATMRGTAPKPLVITVPACVRWGELDPVLQVDWADRLGEYFADLDFAPLAGVGHFPHREDPPRAAAEIVRFFRRKEPSQRHGGTAKK